MKILDAIESEKLLKSKLSLPFAGSRIIEENDLRAVKKFPVVLKIISRKLFHKSDFGAVRIAHHRNELKEGYSRLMSIVRKRKIKDSRIVVQEFVEGKELIVGLKKDSAFGHIVLLGIGGIFTEVIADVSMRVCPVSEKDAVDMIGELKAKKIIYGYRNSKKLSMNFIKKIVVNASRIPEN